MKKWWRHTESYPNRLRPTNNSTNTRTMTDNVKISKKRNTAPQLHWVCVVLIDDFRKKLIYFDLVDGSVNLKWRKNKVNSIQQCSNFNSTTIINHAIIIILCHDHMTTIDRDN